LFALLIVFTAFFILYVVNARKNGGQPVLGNYRLFNIVSGSMEPHIPVGSVVITKTGGTPSIAKGDVISFESNNIVISHRVYDIYTQNNGEKVYSTKGDANKNVDPDVIFSSQIIGKVVLHIPLLGFVLNYVATKQGMIVCVVIPMFVIAFYDIFLFFVELNRYLKSQEVRQTI
jgi:signal peptidase I, archaeal type